MRVVEVMVKIRQTSIGVASLSVQSQCSLILGDWMTGGRAFRLITPPDVEGARRDVMQTCTNVRNTRKHHLTSEALPDIPWTYRSP